MIKVLLVTIYLAVFPYQGSSIILESGNVNDYEVVYPRKVTALSKGAYEDTMQYELKVNGEPVVLHLEKNKYSVLCRGLFSEDYSETHYSPDGREITTYPPVEDHCYYHGHIQNDADSTASISACNGLKGHFKLQGEMYLIEPLELSDSEAHAVFKYENKEDEAPKMCGVTQTNWESDEPIKKASQLVVTAEQQRYVNDFRYVELFIVADYRMFTKYKRDLTEVKTWVYEIVNTLNEDFNGTTIGLAHLASMCEPKRSTGIVQDHSPKNLLVAVTMAHEMGHNLGITHDGNYCYCFGYVCIMNATLSHQHSKYFSNCSFSQCWDYINTYKPQCILNEPLRTDIISPPVCGNELLEVGEECDCGFPRTCRDPCCDASTCKLHSWVECESGECCGQCKVRLLGVFLILTHSLRVQEMYAGQQGVSVTLLKAALANLLTVPRMTSIGMDNHAYTTSVTATMGIAPSHITNVMISLVQVNVYEAEDSCFERNQKGDDDGYCRKENGEKIPCAPEDVKCGRLYCKDNSPRQNDPCKTFDSNEDDHKEMVLPGTKCADGKVSKRLPLICVL
ncbi:hypothetical protein Chor_002303 [Crotalus horridus]